MGPRGPLPPPEEGAQASHRPATLQAPESINARAVPASPALGARLGAHRLLGAGAAPAHGAPRLGLARQSDGPPADGDHRTPFPVHRGGPQSFAPSLARD